MIKIHLQLFGGRGASSGIKGGGSGVQKVPENPIVDTNKLKADMETWLKTVKYNQLENMFPGDTILIGGLRFSRGYSSYSNNDRTETFLMQSMDRLTGIDGEDHGYPFIEVSITNHPKAKSTDKMYTIERKGLKVSV